MNTQSREIERLRHSFRPEKIATLFVGESVPCGGTFFYRRDSHLYRYMASAFGGVLGQGDFLMQFRSKGFFLDDLVLTPVNHKTTAERRKMHLDSVSSLADRLVKYDPKAVVTVLIGIKAAVDDAITRAGLTSIPHYAVPFPSNGNQRRFMEEIAPLIPTLPTL